MKTLIAVTMVVLGAGKATKAPAPKVAPPVEKVTPPADPWEFDDVISRVTAKTTPLDDVSKLAVTQLPQLRLDGEAVFKVSAHANTVGGVTLTFEDRADPKLSCQLYATKEGEALTFKDSRCAFPVLKNQLRTMAVCRRISGTARRVKDTVSIEAEAPDCNASIMGMTLTVRVIVRPL